MLLKVAAPVKVEAPVTVKVVERTWPEEGEVLSVLSPFGNRVPVAPVERLEGHATKRRIANSAITPDHLMNLSNMV